MALIRQGEVAEDPYRRVADGEALPASGAVLVSLDRWRDDRAELIERADPVGVLSDPVQCSEKFE